MNTCRNCGHDEYHHLPECGFWKGLGSHDTDFCTCTAFEPEVVGFTSDVKEGR